jgi:hypothetical protein
VELVSAFDRPDENKPAADRPVDAREDEAEDECRDELGSETEDEAEEAKPIKYCAKNTDVFKYLCRNAAALCGGARILAG